MDDQGRKEKFLEWTEQIWERRVGQDLTREDAREIAENVAGFFRVLLEWSTAEGRSRKQPHLGDGTTMPDGCSE